MKINASILSLLFLFLFAMLTVSCESSDIEDEVVVSLDEKSLNESLEKNNTNTYLVDKDSDRPGNQGGSGN